MALQVRVPLAMIIALLSWVLSMQQNSSSVNGKPQVPCFFIFGDSLADNGNNNLLDSLAKVNYKPYGIDFPGSAATGRFSNGLTTVDILSQLLGFDNYIPPFALLNTSDILKGVNYASGAAGILKESGRIMGGRISMDRQLMNHKITISRISNILGEKKAKIKNLHKSLYSKRLAKRHLSKCLYSVGMGSNDYINNYFLPQYYNTSKYFTTEQYAQALIEKYSQQIKKLHKYGARKVVLVGVGRIGCTPAAISASTNGSAAACVDIMNLAAQQFNQKLVSLVDELNSNYTDSKFVYVDSFEISSGDPAAAGFTVSNVGCCAVNEVGQCKFDQTPCQNRSEYVFWDGFHPTEALNRITAIRSYSNAINPADTYPMDISHLAQLKINHSRASYN